MKRQLLASLTSAWPDGQFCRPVNADIPEREAEHLRRAKDHKAVGDILGEAQHEWAAVTWFYSAYHLMRASLLVDPIFDDVRVLSRVNVDMTPETRFTSRHKGRRPMSGQAREWGLNDLVLKLYRPAAGSYERLHQASITVRYGAGLPKDALPSLTEALDKIHAMHDAGQLVTAMPFIPPKS